MSRQADITYGSAPLDAHLEFYSFDTDGTNNPSVFGGAIESVARKSTAGGLDFYRITFTDARPLDSASIHGESWTVVQTEADDLRAVRMTGLVATSGGAATSDLEIDLVVIDESEDGGGIKVGATNAVAAGRTVRGFICYDLAED